MNIVFLDENTVTLGDIDFSCLHKLGSYEGFSNSTELEIIERAAGADVVIANKSPISRRVLDALTRLKLVTVVATGYNNVDVKAAKDKGVCVCNVPGYATVTVAQHTFALILNLAVRAYAYHNDIMEGKWESAGSFNLLTYPTFELAGKTIGIIGFGAIGREVAAIAAAFGMKILVNDALGIRDGACPNTDIETLLKNSDVVTLHCPLTEDNRSLINAAALSKMKRTAVLINTARGGLVDEEALYNALRNGQIAGAGVDVLSKEPPRDGNILLRAPNIIITPHSAWSTVEARQRLIDQTAHNIRAFAQARPRNVVA